MKRTTIVFILVIVFILGGFFYVRNRIYYAHGKNLEKVILHIEKGDGNGEIADKLEKEGLISGKYYFYYYLEVNKLLNKIFPGDYELSGNLTIPEIATLLTENKENFIKITFPEGWTSKQMATRLTENGLDGEGFLQIVNNPGEISSEFDFLINDKVKNLEGYLFPDTYFFAKDIDAHGIIEKILKNFDNRLSLEMRQSINAQKKSIFETIILASIIEREVSSYEDRRIVSGIIKNRLDVGQPLQCDSTLAFILGDNKKQYSYNESRTNSPYNTYINKGLPPGPISNPGTSAITATLDPVKTQFNYFLSDPATGQTIFAKTFEEHKANKLKYGL